ncbi:MAG TPA: AAA family ATPase [Thermomicrobiales bacterium]|nr:AAA family ATPase [Thermomicrobiales bacterium]
MALSGPQSIFLSYSREDVAFARELREWLLSQGQQPWMDLFDIPAGARWPDEIDRALRASDAVIGLMSPSGVASENVKNEWDWAIANNRRLILLLIEPCEAPFHYVSRNYIDFTAEREAGFASLLRALQEPGKAEVDVTPHAAGPPAHPARPPSAGVERDSRLRRALSRRRAEPDPVGREQEQHELRGQLEKAMAGDGGLLLLGGEAGIGKTTLVGWLREQAEDGGALALSGGCYDLSVTPPYGPWIEVLRSYQPDAALPPLPPRIRDEAGIESLASQAALFELAGEFFAEVSERRPLLLVLEDLHWADPASLEFLRFFARFLGGLPVLLVATYRDDELTRRHPLAELMPLLAREAGARRVRLNRLDENGARALIAVRFPLPPADADRLAALVQQMAGGNPFFANEVLQSLVEQGILTDTGAGWTLGALDDLRLPPLVREVIESRLLRLDDETRALLEIAAVVGQVAPLDLWSAVSGLPEEAMIRVVEQALSAGIVVEDEARAGVTFSHALVRETLYEGIVLLRRRVLHRRIGEALVATVNADPDAIAHHFWQANDHRAIEWMLRAAQRAERRYSWIMASERYEAALQMLGDDERHARERGWLLLHIGRLLRFSVRDSASVYLEEARQIATSTGDRRLDASALWLRGIIHLIDGDVERGLAAKEQAIHMLDSLLTESAGATAMELFPDEPASADFRLMPWLRARDELAAGQTILGWATLSQWTAYAGRFARASEIAAMVERGDSADARSHLLHGAMHQQAVHGMPGEARLSSQRSYRFYSSIEHHIPLAAGLINHILAVHLPYFTDDLEERRWLNEAALGHQSRSTYTSGVNPTGRGLQLLQVYEGRWDDAERGGLSGFERAAPVIWQSQACAALALLAHYRGDDDAAQDYVHRLFPAAGPPEPGQTSFVSTLYLLRAAIEIALGVGDANAARAWLVTYGKWLDWAEAVMGRAEEQALWARYHWLSGDLQAARVHGARALERATKPRQPLALIAAHRVLGTLDRDEGSHASAASHLTQSLQLAETCALPFERALTLLELARLRLATGQFEDARDSLAEVRAICEPLRATLVLDEVAALEAGSL